MIRTAEHLATLPEGEHKHVTIRSAVPGQAGDLAFMDHLQKKFRNQIGFLPTCALEHKIARGQVSIAFENDEPAAYILGQSNYQRDPSFGIIYQAAVSYDSRRRLLGTALVQHFMDHMQPGVKLIGLWCAQDIEANEFWDACGFEAVAARHGSQRKGRVHIFWVGRTLKGKNEPMRFPKATSGGLMREKREVFEIKRGSHYEDVKLPPAAGRFDIGGQRHLVAAPPPKKKLSLREQQLAFVHGASGHICIVVRGVTKWVPVAPFGVPDFADLARTMVAKAA